MTATTAPATRTTSAARLLLKVPEGALYAIGTLVAAVFLAWMLGYEAPQVISDSMEPTIMVGDNVVRVPAKVEDVSVGEVISFRMGSIVNTHRVIAVNPDGSLTTKGDGNTTPDPTTVTDANLLGKVPYMLTDEGAKNLALVVPSSQFKGEVVHAVFDGEWDRLGNLKSNVPWVFLAGLAGAIGWGLISMARKIARWFRRS